MSKSATIPPVGTDGRRRCAKCQYGKLVCIAPDAPGKAESYICSSCASLRDCPLPPKTLTAYRKYIDSIRGSDFNVRANDIVTVIDDLRKKVRRFLRDHHDKCQCVFCRTRDYDRFDITTDLSGVLWALDIASSCVGGCVLLTEKNCRG